MVNIKLSNKTFFLLLTGLLLVLASGLAIAWNSNNPQIHGHTANEISGLPSGGSGGKAGTYSGTGAQQDIVVGFQPIFLEIYNDNGYDTVGCFLPSGATHYCCKQHQDSRDCDENYNSGFKIDPLPNGFRIVGTLSHINGRGSNYGYFAAGL
jgi:hypothetical protein